MKNIIIAALIIAGVGGNPLNAGRKTRYKDFAPRVGLAYRFTEKTVFFELVTCWCLAVCPTRISPFSVKAA